MLKDIIESPELKILAGMIGGAFVLVSLTNEDFAYGVLVGLVIWAFFKSMKEG